MAASPIDHPFLSGLLGDPEIGALFSADADIAAMIAFEEALAEAEAAEGAIPGAAGEAIGKALSGAAVDMTKLAEGTARDGVVVPELVRQLRETVAPEHREHVHFGATSQDAIDTSLALRLMRVCAILGDRVDRLVETLSELERTQGSAPVIAHTRMQAAIPVAAARKIRSWREPLARHRRRFMTVSSDLAILYFGGAAGTLDKLGDRGEGVARRMAARLGLRPALHPRHSERDGMTDFASWLSLLTGSLGKMGQDIALAAQSEVGEIKLSSGGGSSAMPHKLNPVGAEVLVAVARFNATLVSGMHHSLIHENERSGAAWTLEWMLLPQMTVATGAALRIALELVDNIEFVARKSA